MASWELARRLLREAEGRACRRPSSSQKQTVKFKKTRHQKLTEGETMKTSFWLAGVAALAFAQPALAADTIKIGFVSTFSGPTAVIGNDMRNSFELALDHLGRKMGG